MPLSISESGGIFTCAWDNGIVMKFDHMYEDSKGIITGEIWIENTQAQPAFLYHGRTTITSGEIAVKIGNACQKRGPDAGVSWPDLVEAARVNVMKRFRMGEPFLDLLDVPMNEGASYMVDPLCYFGQANLMFGPGGVGKSMVAMYVGILSAAGIANDDTFDVEPGNVCLLDYETSPDEAKFRYAGICEGLNLMNPPNFYYRRSILPVAQDIARIQAYCKQFNITFLIIDSAAPAVGGDTFDTGLTVNYFNSLRSLGITTLTIAHVKKEAPKDSAPYGNVFWLNLPRTVWRVDAGDDSNNPSAKHVGLFHVKVNNGPKLKAIGIEISFIKDEYGLNSITVLPKDINDSVLSTNLSLSDQVKNLLLSTGAMTVAEIKDALGTSGAKDTSALSSFLSNSIKGAKPMLYHNKTTKQYAVIAQQPSEYQTAWTAPDD